MLTDAIAAWIREGKTQKEIADSLGYSVTWVKETCTKAGIDTSITKKIRQDKKIQLWIAGLVEVSVDTERRYRKQLGICHWQGKKSPYFGFARWNPNARIKPMSPHVLAVQINRYGITELAKYLGVTRANCNNWRKKLEASGYTWTLANGKRQVEVLGLDGKRVE